MEETERAQIERLDERPRRQYQRGRPDMTMTRSVATTVLIVDADPQMQRALRVNLATRGYQVLAAPSGAAALQAATDRLPDVVILDLDLPDLDGTEVIAGLRGWSTMPIIVLSARTHSEDKIHALDVGADDYVTKPFVMGELLARLRAIRRRHTPSTTVDDEAAVETESFTVDLVAKKVHKDGVDVHLTPTEWGLLELLVRNPGRLMAQRQLLQHVWGPDHTTESHYLRVYLNQLRRKLESDPAHPRHLLTEPGMGYRFER
jgi:two-component system KDP operon response regulator KdpE